VFTYNELLIISALVETYIYLLYEVYEADNIICLTYTCCCMYSLELLMMDEKIVRNM